MSVNTYRRLKDGDKYGRLTILSYSHMQPPGKSIYKVKCECGNEKEVVGASLVSGNTTSCGCYQKERAKEAGQKKTFDLTDRTFGNLTVIKQDLTKTKKNAIYWLCQCNCGNTKSITSLRLLRSRSKSCGSCSYFKEPSKRIHKGYVILSGIQDHENSRNGSIYEHRYVMSQKLGRPLLPNENVHHINGIKHDNRPENLELWIRSQPAGQRVEDLLHWAEEIIKTYSKDLDDSSISSAS